MRLWSLHPKYLDAKGLVAAWREALLARQVLAGRTRGYRHHPQLERFRAHPDPQAAMASFLAVLADEGHRRGYRFDGRKVPRRRGCACMEETEGQLLHEWRHLKAKLRRRAPALARAWRGVHRPDAHPLFQIVPGPVRPWERSLQAGRRNRSWRPAVGRKQGTTGGERARQSRLALLSKMRKSGNAGPFPYSHRA